MTFGEPINPCGDCIDGPDGEKLCTMNCSTPLKPGSLHRDGWRPASSAPKDGTHIQVCAGPYSAHWGFNQSPPAVVHYWSNPGEEGFYLSHGLVEGSYNDKPFRFDRWRALGAPPIGDLTCMFCGAVLTFDTIEADDNDGIACGPCAAAERAAQAAEKVTADGE